MGRTWKPIKSYLDFPWEGLVGRIILGKSRNPMVLGQMDDHLISGVIASVERDRSEFSDTLFVISANDLQHIRRRETGDCWQDYSAGGGTAKSVQMVVMGPGQRVDKHKKTGCIYMSHCVVNFNTIWIFPSLEYFNQCGYPPREFATLTARSA